MVSGRTAGRAIFFVLLAVWAGLYVWSFTVFWTQEPTGDGFTRGLNRVAHFLGLQFAAGLAGVLVWGFAGVWPKGSAGRWIGRLPAGLGALLLLGLVLLYLYANFGTRIIAGRIAADPPATTRPAAPVAEPVDPGPASPAAEPQ